MNPPSGGWPTGAHFRVNFVRDTNSLSTIYAQSVEFSILPPNGTSSTCVFFFRVSCHQSSCHETDVNPFFLSSTSLPPTTVYTSVVDSPSDTGVTVPAAASGALAAYSANTGVIAFLSLLAYFS